MRTLPRVIAAVALFAVPVSAALADEAADQLKAQVLKAYKETTQYQGVTTFEFVQTSGRWESVQRGTFNIALDRAANKLQIDKPDLLLVSDGSTLRLRSEEIPERHLEVPAPTTLTYKALATEAPFLNRPPLPDVAMLLSDDPFALLSDAAAASLKAVAPDADQRPGLSFTSTTGTMTLRFDPKSYMVRSARLDMDAAKNGGKPGDKAALNYAISVAKRNQAVDAGAFAFNVNGSTAVGSLEEWARGPHATQDKDAPRVTLKFTDGVAYDLAKDKSQVIVLDFWATWCGPCRESMPELEQVRKWAAENKKPVGIYLVNLRESAEKINAALKEDKVNLASLMDTDGKVAESYGVEGIPHLVVIEGGKIRKVHIGNTPGKGEKLKKEIDALLNKKS